MSDPIYVVARSARTSRPTCQHIVAGTGSTLTALCGYDLYGSSRDYLPEAIPAILCLRCKKIEEAGR